MKTSILIIVAMALLPAISSGFAACIVNEDWPEVPCLDTIVNGWYDQDEVDQWANYYSYKGSAFMEQKFAELSDAIREDKVEQWASESTENRNVYEYYFFSGRAPNTGEYNARFNVIAVNEETVKQDVTHNIDFEIWPEQSVLTQGSYIKLNGKICPAPYDLVDLDPFFHEESEEQMNEDGILFMYYMQKPDGTTESQMRNSYELVCTDEITPSFHADQLGDYTVYAEATWNSNGIKKVASNTVTITAIERIFDYTIEPVTAEKSNWMLHEPLYWSQDGKSILFRVWIEPDSETRITSLVLISPDGTIQKELEIPGSVITGVDHAQIAPTNDIVHILDNGKMYRYVLETDQIVQLDTEDHNVMFFDYYYYDEGFSIVYSIKSLDLYTDDPTSFYTLLIVDDNFPDLHNSPSEFFSNLETPVYQFSPDGKKILYVKTLEAGYGWADRVPAYVGAQDYGPHIIPNVELNCGRDLKWSPNGQMIIFQDNRCGRTVDSGMLGVATMDGYSEKLIPQINISTQSYPRAFAISPDGSQIAFVTGSGKSDYGEAGDFYMMTLAKPIPEFESLAGLILAASIILIVLFQKLRERK